MWYLYIVQASDNSLYTGITTDIQRRVLQHNEGNKGAKSLRGKRPVILKYFERFEDSIEAKKREYEIKHWNREKKLDLIKKF